ncbi:neuropeptide F isoform X2 [Eupeodes corollae]|uniref:neuropeptide F isoform X2 n=1 Tax=Eupeodes corollae TaxID=290404 RepID=UPI002492E00D|nr:neuropeptide F isoform X2 [Eupeodes corollae]
MASQTVTRFGIFICIIMLVSYVSASMSRPPRNNDINNMADALRYLQDLDNYYGDKARVRFGKRGPLLLRDRLMEEAAADLKDSQRHYSFRR